MSASSAGGLVLGILFGALFGACLTCLILKRRTREHYKITQCKILNNKEVFSDDNHHNTDYEDMDTVRANYLELNRNKSCEGPTELGKNEAYESSIKQGENPMELGENDVYEYPDVLELSENDAYERSDDPILAVYDN